MDTLRMLSLTGITLLALAPVAPAQQKKEPGKGIDGATVAAYQKVGATYGGWKRYVAYYGFEKGPKAAEAGIPGFHFEKAPTGSLPEVRVPFGLSFGVMTDAGLKELGGHRTLALLVLSNTQITDAGLKQLAPLKDLTVLNLSLNRVTDEGLRDVAGLPNLTTLFLERTQVTPAGLKNLARLTRLVTLHLDKGVLTDEALRTLREVGFLYPLLQAAEASGGRPKSADDVAAFNLRETPVTDGGLKELASLKNLAAIRLGKTQVTGAGLKDLAPLKTSRRSRSFPRSNCVGRGSRTPSWGA